MSEGGGDTPLSDHGSTSWSERAIEITWLVGLVCAGVGVPLAFVVTGSILVTLAVALGAVVFVALGMLVLARSRRLTVLEVLRSAAADEQVEAGGGLEDVASHLLWTPTVGMLWAVIAYALTGGADLGARTATVTAAGLFGAASAAAFKPRRYRFLDDWSDQLFFAVVGVLGVVDGVRAIAGGGRIVDWSLGPVSLVFGLWVLSAIAWDRRRPKRGTADAS